MPPTAARSHALLAVAVLVGGLGFAAGSVTAADAGPKPVTKAQVKKIAAKQARKVVRRAAPTLHVASADTVVDQRTRPFAVALAPDATPVVVGTVSGLTITAGCPSASPSLKIGGPDGRYRAARFVNATLSGAGDGDLAGSSQEVLTGPTGSGTFDYMSAAGKAVAASYGWRSESGQCFIFGTLLG